MLLVNQQNYRSLKKSVFFNKTSASVKTGENSLFDVQMEILELKFVKYSVCQ